MRRIPLSRLVLLGAILACAGAGVYVFTSSRTNAARPTVLKTARVARATVSEELTAMGTIKPEVGAIVKVGCQATGRIKRMHVRVGQTVRRGDLIAEIDDREVAAERAEDEAELRQAEAELNRVRTVYPLQINEAEAELAAARAKADYAGLNLERVRELESKQLETRDALDAAQSEADVTANDVRVCRARLTRLCAERDRTLEKAREAVAMAASALKTTSVRQTYTLISSPIDGVVSRVAAQEGETVVAGLQVANLITIVDPTRLELQIFVDENDITRVHAGSPVHFEVDGYPGRVFDGTVDRIAPEPELRNDLVYYVATVRLDARTAAALKPEMSARCRITARVRDNVPALPNNALKWISGKQVVFVVRPGGDVEAIDVTLGLQGPTQSEVLQGVAEGDEVATELVHARSD